MMSPLKLTPHEEAPALGAWPWASYRASVVGDQDIDPAMLPDFMVIAPPKSGTTWLSNNLSEHPQIFIPPQKEVHYFDVEWRNHPIQDYIQEFESGIGRTKGDVTPGYAILPSMAIETIAALRPDMKLIFLMRNPVERAWSHLKHAFAYRQGAFRDETALELGEVSEEVLMQHFMQDEVLMLCDYQAILAHWRPFFAPGQFHLAYFENLVGAPEMYLQTVFHFLGVTEDYFPRPEVVADKANATDAHFPMPPRIRATLERFFLARAARLSVFLADQFQFHEPAPWGLLADKRELACVAMEDSQSRWLDSLHRREQQLSGAGTRQERNACFVSLIESTAQDVGRKDMEPVLVGSHDGFNVVTFRSRFYGLDQTLELAGIANLAQLGHLMREAGPRRSFVAETLEQAVIRIEQLRGRWPSDTEMMLQ